jgi:RNA-directed DNA polymerase
MTMDEVLSRENLNAAYRVVKANAGAPGVDGMSVEELTEHVRKHWDTLQSKLRTGEYQPAAVRAVEIPKAKGGVRTLGIPTVVDRLIQQGVHQVLSPIFEKDFSDHSYGFRPGRSAQDAVRAAQEYVKAGKGWVVDIDLKAFFDQVNHDKLMNLVGRKIRDKEILKLIGKYLRAPMQRAGERSSRQRDTAGRTIKPPVSEYLPRSAGQGARKAWIGVRPLCRRHCHLRLEPTLSRTHTGKRG